VFIQVAVPTRQDVTEYKQLKREVDQLVGRINGRYGGVGHNPIHYLFKSVNSQGDKNLVYLTGCSLQYC
jgi:trehalose-6-phosphate synthase